MIFITIIRTVIGIVIAVFIVITMLTLSSLKRSRKAVRSKLRSARAGFRSRSFQDLHLHSAQAGPTYIVYSKKNIVGGI